MFKLKENHVYEPAKENPMSENLDKAQPLQKGADEAEQRSLSPSASPFVPNTSESPVFIPKWKQQAAAGAGCGGGKGSSEDEDDHQRKDVSFSNDFGRSLSGNFPPSRNAGLRSRPVANPKSPLRQSSALSGLRSNSWREDPSWRDAATGAATTAEESKTSKAITVEHRLIRPGAYSTWIRVLSADIGAQQLASVLSRCEESNAKGAIHVYLREKFINRQLVQQLKSQGYKFHHYVEDTETFVYGKRPLDAEAGKELMNATSKELIGSLILSPDHKQVLLLWEGGKWMYTTGCANTRESVTDAMKREIRRDLNVELDKTFTPQLVGGWHRASAKFDCINETFLCFCVQASSTVLDLDEETHARWFEVDELMQLLDMVDEQFKEANMEPKLDSAIEHPPGNVFSHLTLRWLKAFVKGVSWQTTHIAERHIFCSV